MQPWAGGGFTVAMCVERNVGTAHQPHSCSRRGGEAEHLSATHHCSTSLLSGCDYYRFIRYFFDGFPLYQVRSQHRSV
jgi:hypothetical protein